MFTAPFFTLIRERYTYDGLPPAPVCALVPPPLVNAGGKASNRPRTLTARQITICRTEERYRAAQGRNDHTYLAHDLAARPTGKFQFTLVPSKADNHSEILSVIFSRSGIAAPPVQVKARP